jgi:hypothetical protein
VDECHGFDAVPTHPEHLEHFFVFYILRLQTQQAGYDLHVVLYTVMDFFQEDDLFFQ